MTWRAVVAALDDHETLRSSVSVYLHPLGGRPIIWHVLHSLLEVTPPPSELRVLHHGASAMAAPPEGAGVASFEHVERGRDLLALRAAVTPPGMTILVDGAAPLVAPATIARLLRAGEQGITALHEERGHGSPVGVAGEGPALASAEDPRRPVGASRVAPTSANELLRVVDRHTLSDAAVALRDRLVREHESRGVTFLLPATSWVDVDVRIGADTMIYPGAVIEGGTEIGSGCVIGPHSRVIEASIGRGVELRGWNYVSRTSIRNHAVLEPYVRRGSD